MEQKCRRGSDSGVSGLTLRGPRKPDGDVFPDNNIPDGPLLAVGTCRIVPQKRSLGVIPGLLLLLLLFGSNATVLPGNTAPTAAPGRGTIGNTARCGCSSFNDEEKLFKDVYIFKT